MGEEKLLKVQEIALSMKIGENESDLQFYERLKQTIEQAIKTDPDNRDLRMQYADYLIDPIIDGLYSYSGNNKRMIKENAYFKLFEDVVIKIKPVSPIHSAIIDIVNGNNKAVINNIKKWFEMGTCQLKNNEFVYALLMPLKDGFPGMWTAIKDIMKSHDVQSGLPEMCEALEAIYHSNDNEQIINALAEVLRINKKIYIATEFLGYTYYQMKMWKNAIACFSSIVDDKDIRLYFLLDNVYFWLAWSHGQSKNLIESEACYRKVLYVFPDAADALNNLGYCLYKQKRYDEAKEIFEELIKQKRDLPYAANNLVRVFLAMGQYEKAVTFINSYNSKIATDLIKRAKELREQKGEANTTASVSYIEALDSNNGDIPESPTPIRLGLKYEQFASEKLLEDELTIRMEKGFGAFGLPLSIYEKKGEYGRQYIIPVGRIDILAVDREGNFYVIELKKDSGYDDAYAQTLGYIKWIEKHMAKKNEKVYGIICLNNPNNKLVEKVNSNPQMRLFEYAISYTEVY